MNQASQSSNMTTVNKYLKSSLFSVLIGEVATMVLLLLFSVLMCNVDIPDVGGTVFIIAATSIGGFFAGYVNGRILKHKGIIAGAICGTMLMIILIILKLAFFMPLPDGVTVLKLALVLVSGIIGGIMGVNKKKQKLH